MNHQKHGFTLLEVMLVNAIMIIVIAAVTLMWQFIIKNYSFSMDQYDLTQDANNTVRKIETELRQAQEAMQGAYPLAILEDNQLAFYADIDDNGLIERLRYYVVGDALMRGVVQPSGNPPEYNLAAERSSVVVKHINHTGQPLFTYYSLNWPQDTVNNPLPLADRPIQTRLVRIRIPINLSSTLSGESSHTAEATVHIRNLKNSL